MRRKSLVFLVLILLGGLFLRIWKLEELFVFGFDEEVIAFRAKQLLANHKLFLIGGVTPLRVHLGPLFYYFSSLLLVWPWRLNPLSWGVWAGVLSSLAVFLIYWTGKKFFNERVGMIAAFLQGFSFYQIIHDRHYWPLFLNPLFSLLVLLSLGQIIKKYLNWVFVLAIVLSFAWQTDPTSWPLFILVIIAWWLFALPVKNKKVFFAFCLLLASFFPLIAFDIRHQGSNISGLWQFKSETEKSTALSNEKLLNTLIYLPQGLAKLLWTSRYEPLFYHRFFLREMNHGQMILSLVVFWLLFLVFKRTLKERKEKPVLPLLSLSFFITFIGVFFYGNFVGFDLWNHYLVILFPIFFLSLAVFADSIWESHWYALVPFFLVIFSFFNIRELWLYKPPFNFKNKMVAVNWTKQVLGEEEFALESLSEDSRFNGIRYLFYLVNKEPVISFVDPPLFWLYDHEPGGQYPKNFVVFVSQDFAKDSEEGELYQQYQAETFNSQTFGDIEVLIVDNEEQQFTVDY